MENEPKRFEEVKTRLDRIVEAVSDDDLSLDDALKLYEEAVQLGLAASSLLEENIDRNNAEYEAEQAESGLESLDADALDGADVVLEDEVIVTEEDVPSEAQVERTLADADSKTTA